MRYLGRTLTRSHAGMVALMSTTLSPRRRLLAVFCGGFCGTLVRYALSLFMQGWPYDILLINVTGALILAFVTTLADATLLVGPTRRLFINVGFLGAYTTFSSLALGDVLLFANGHWLPALLYLVLSIGGGVLAVWCGDWLGHWVIDQAKRPGARWSMVRAPSRSVLSQKETSSDDHLDVQNDVLLPEGQVEVRNSQNVLEEHEWRRRGDCSTHNGCF
jgi:CrcB protein